MTTLTIVPRKGRARFAASRHAMTWVPLLIVLACSSPEHTPQPRLQERDWGPHASELPTLATVFDAEPESPAEIVTTGLAPDGSMLVTTDRSGPDPLAVIDTTGKVRLTFGRSGAGPGELQAIMWTGTTSNGFAAFDRRLLKMVLFDSTGAPLKDLRRRGSPLMIPALILDDSTVLAVIPDPTGELHSLPATFSLTSGDTRILVPASDTFLSRFEHPNGGPDLSHNPIIGRWLGGVVVGDSRDYTLAFYDWSGKLLRTINRTPKDRPTRTLASVNATLAELTANPASRTRLTGAALERERQRLLDEKLPYFRSTPNIDGQGRLWIVGQAGDSGYADLFGPSGFIGREALSCPGFDGSGWRVNGHWLALRCRTDNPASRSGNVLKLLRIEG